MNTLLLVLVRKQKTVEIDLCAASRMSVSTWLIYLYSITSESLPNSATAAADIVRRYFRTKGSLSLGVGAIPLDLCTGQAIHHFKWLTVGRATLQRT